MSPSQRRHPAPRLESLESRELLSALAHPKAEHAAPVAHHPIAAWKAHLAEAQAVKRTGVDAKAKFHLDLRAKDIRVSSNSFFGPPAAAFTPAQLNKAYGIDQLPQQGQGVTIAIVDPGDDPRIASDLATFSREFNLPQLDGAGGDGTFTKATPDGHPFWSISSSLEISLDVEWVHAVAPKANILLVESLNSNDILAADRYAAAQPGVVVVSNSWSGGEYVGEASADSNFVAPNGHDPVAFTFSTGDSGAPAGYPSFSPNVVAVGGTTLTLNPLTNTYNHESGWSGSGGSVSLLEPTPSFQAGLGFAKRAVPDVSSDADLNTGVAVYDSFFARGWYQVGGTSLSAPTWGALIGLAQQARIANSLAPLSSAGVDARLYAAYNAPLQYAADFHDITTGNNGNAAGTGYDLVTGIGSPKAPQIVNLLSNTA